LSNGTLSLGLGIPLSTRLIPPIGSLAVCCTVLFPILLVCILKKDPHFFRMHTTNMGNKTVHQTAKEPIGGIKQVESGMHNPKERVPMVLAMIVLAMVKGEQTTAFVAHFSNLFLLWRIS